MKISKRHCAPTLQDVIDLIEDLGKKLITKLNLIVKKETRIMAQLDDIKAAMAETKTSLHNITTDLDAQAAEIKKLQDQIAAGNPVTVEDLEALKTEAQSIRDAAAAADAKVPAATP